jgi:hypothetical protein
MQGWLSDKCKNPSPSWYIFQDPNHVYPHHIIDFASTSGDPKDEMAKITQVNKLRLEEEQKFLASFKSVEENFEKKMRQRLTDAHQKYLTTLRNLLKALESSRPEQLPSFVKTFLREKDQIRHCLPIYLHRESIISTIKEKRVVVILSETGSGSESSQIHFFFSNYTDILLQGRALSCLNIVSMLAPLRKTRGKLLFLSRGE